VNSISVSVSNIWTRLESAKVSKSRIKVITSSGTVVEGILILIDDVGNLEIKMDNGATMVVYFNKIDCFSVMDNLTYVEVLAKEKNLI
jgi:hypothetical protein